MKGTVVTIIITGGRRRLSFGYMGPRIEPRYSPAQTRFRRVNNRTASGPYLTAAPDGVKIEWRCPAIIAWIRSPSAQY
jgi:hypothetical protein